MNILEGSLLEVLVWRKEKWVRHAWQRNWMIYDSQYEVEL